MSLKIDGIHPIFVNNKVIEKEVKTHYPIYLSFYRSFQIFCLNKIECLLCFSKKKLTTTKRLLKLYKIGSERMNKEMSIENIIKHLRDLKILIHNNYRNEL